MEIHDRIHENLTNVYGTGTGTGIIPYELLYYANSCMYGCK